MAERRSILLLTACVILSIGSAISRAEAQRAAVPAPPGRLVDLGGYRLHLLCTGPSQRGRPTVVMSIGGGGFAVDWSLVQRPLSDSTRVCSYDRPGWGWSDPGPTPRTFRQEAYELYRALRLSGEAPPYLVVGQSLGGFVLRQFALDHPGDVVGMVLVEPANENGKVGFRGQWVVPRTLASDRPVPAPRGYSTSPPKMMTSADCDAARASAARTARINPPFDKLGADAQRHRLWALSHPSCAQFEDDYIAEEMAGFYNRWAVAAHPLGQLPLVVLAGTRPRTRPPGLTEADMRSDSLRLDLSRLSTGGKLIADSTSGHQLQLDNPGLVVRSVLELLGGLSKR